MGKKNREMIIKFPSDDVKPLMISTDFDNHELEEAADIIQEQLMDTEDGWNEEKVVAALEKKGYIKVLKEAPEILELYI